MEIDLKHIAKCIRDDGNPDFSYIGQHFGETPGWGDLAAEVLRLSKINTQLVTDFNAMNQHGAKQDARIAALEALVAAADRLAEFMLTTRDYVDDASKGLILYRGRSMLVEMATEDLAKIDTALAAYRAVKEAANE